MLNLHALDDRGAVVGDDDVSAGAYDLRRKVSVSSELHGGGHHCANALTILSMPFGPRLVRTASAIARAAVMLLCRTVLPRVFCSLLCGRWHGQSLEDCGRRGGERPRVTSLDTDPDIPIAVQ